VKTNKIILIVAFILLFTLSLTACNNDGLGEYKKAAEKTEQVKMGQKLGEFTVKMDFDTEGMTPEEIKELNYYKDINGSFNVTYDNNLEKRIFKNYLNLGGLGFDYDLYKNSNETYLKLPVTGKYMKLDELMTSLDVEQKEHNETEDKNAKSKNIISEGTFNLVSEKWISLMKKDDVFKGKNIVLTTPDGEVKTTEYTIKLNDEQIKNLFKGSVDIITKDESFKEFYVKMQNNIGPLKDTTLEKLVADIKTDIDNYKVEKFSYTAYVDVDGYIVNEIVEVALTLNVDNEQTEHNGRLKSVNYGLDTKNWDINKEQKFDFPVLTNDNTVDVNDMDENMMLLQDIFKNID